MHTLYSLCEWGLGIKSASSLSNDGIYLEDYIYNGSYGFKGKFKGETIISLIKKVGVEELKKKSVYDLYEFGLSMNIIQKCIDNKITYEELCRENQKLISLFSNSTYTKIMDCVDLDKAYKFDTKTFTKNYLCNIAKFKSIKISFAKEKFQAINDYPFENFESDLKYLTEKNIVNIDGDIISINYPSIYNLLEDVQPELKDIVLSKMKGKTLEEIGNNYNTSKETIRQKIEIFFDTLPDVIEDKHVDMFTKYHWDFKSFSFFYNESYEVYNYLKYRYHTGKIGLYELINFNLTNEQRDYLFKHHNLVSMDDQVMFGKKDTILRCFMASRCKKEPIKASILFEEYNQYVNQNNYSEYGFSSLAVLQNYLENSAFSLSGFNDEIRFYDFTKYTDMDLFKMSSLLELPKGYYSTLMLFRNNPILMEKYNILNEYELHNFLKRINGKDHLVFRKMPVFYVGNVNRDEFLYRVIQSSSPISQKDLLRLLEEGYGHKMKTIEMQLKAFKRYLNNGVYNCLQTIVTEEDVLEMKSLVDAPILTIKELFEILTCKFPRFSSEMVRDDVIDKLGYYVYHTAYLVKKEISDVDKYLQALALDPNHKTDINVFNKLCPLYLNAIQPFLDDFTCVLTPDLLYNPDKLAKNGVSKEMIIDYIEAIKNRVSKGELFTIYSIRQDATPLEKLSLDITFYETILIQSKQFHSINFNSFFFFMIKDPLVPVVDFFDIFSKACSMYGSDNIFTDMTEKFGFKTTPEQMEAALFQRELPKINSYKK